MKTRRIPKTTELWRAVVPIKRYRRLKDKKPIDTRSDCAQIAFIPMRGNW